MKPGRKEYDENIKFTQQGDVRLARARPWVYGATTDDGVLEVDIVHTERERLVSPDTGKVHVVRHPPVTINFRYDMTKGVGSLDCLRKGNGDLSDPELFTVSNTGEVLAAAFGPFTRWRVTIRQR